MLIGVPPWVLAVLSCGGAVNQIARVERGVR